MAYKVKVSLVNEDKGYVFSEYDEELERDWTLNDDGTPDFGQIYRLARREYGRCTSSVYVDRDGKPPARIGWYFVKRERYEDTGQPYLRGAWVTVVETLDYPAEWPVVMGAHK